MKETLLLADALYFLFGATITWAAIVRYVAAKGDLLGALG